MITRKTFLFFLVDTYTGKAYYYDNTGALQLILIQTASVPVDLPHAPGNWEDVTLAFDRNMTYFGLNRSYSTSMEFVLSVKKMIEQLTLQGVGVEAGLTLAVYKQNTQPLTGEPNYKLYYKAPLDLPEATTTVLETLSCNLMEGGVSQLLKNYENTPLEIPCDGSLPEHIKANCDGYLQEDVFYYAFVPGVIGVAGLAYASLPTVFLNNINDNYGVVHSDTVYKYPTGVGSLEDNYNIYSSSSLKITINGSITFQPTDGGGAINGIDVIVNRSTDTPSSLSDFIVQSQPFTGERIFYFTKVITLQQLEKFAMLITQTDTGGGTRPVRISGNFSIKFASKPKDSRPWGMTAYDLWRLIGQRICEIASITSQPINYNFTSDLLQQYLNFFVTCGDALRASNDPTYQRFFYIDVNNQTQFGPVIKITLKQFFESYRVPLMAAVGRQQNDTTGADELFFEVLEKVFNSSVVDYSIGEVAKMKYDLQSKDFRLSELSIGYDPQTYDQKAGKYEWNTTAKYKAPIKSFQKELKLISFVRWDVYGIQRLLANVDTGASTSTTRNDSDNAVFGIVIDRTKWIMDYFRAQFISIKDDPDDANNTNIHFETLQEFQKFDHPITDGEYFKVNKDFGIFVFSEVGYSATETTAINISGIINSVNRPLTAPVDSIIIRYWRNGVVLKTYTIPVSGINTPITIADSFSQAYALGDCVYTTMETSAYAEAQINTASLAIGSYVLMSGANQPVLSGISQVLLNLPTVVPNNSPYVVGTSKVQSGFQYFQYNSLAYGNNFDTLLGVLGYREGQVANTVFYVWLNGVITDFITISGSIPRTLFAQASAGFNRSYQLNDIVFVTCSITGTNLHTQLVTSTLTFTSTLVNAYNLYRIQYDNLTGIPNLAQDGTGAFRTDLPGSPYNIEFVSPRRCLEVWNKGINSYFLDQVTDDMINLGLSKNPYLSTTVGALTITENANKSLLTGGRLFYPIPVSAEFYCPLNFAELQTNIANGHIHFTFYGHDYYIHVLHAEQKPALNATTVISGLLSPLVDLSIFANITAFKLPTMGPNSIFYDFMNTVQFVPINQVQPAKYKTFNRNQFLFKQQVGRWQEKSGYCTPVQIIAGDPDQSDKITLQFITRDLDPISYTVYRCTDNTVYRGPEELDTIPTPSLASSLYTFILWQKYIDTSGWDEGEYYIIISSTTGDQLISECLDCRFNWPGTVLIEFTSSQDVGQMVFISDVPFHGSLRVKGFYDNMFKQDFTGKFYIDQTADITVLNAIPSEHTDFFIVGDGGNPDWLIKKIHRISLLDGVTYDGEGYSRNGETELEEIFTKGAPKKFIRMPIRPSENLYGITVASAAEDRDSSIITTINLQSVDPNVDNESGTTATDLLDILVNP